MGRPPKGRAIVDRLQGSAYARERLRWILAVHEGDATIEEACGALGIGESRFHELREQALSSALSGLEPRPRGRPKSEEPLSRDAFEALGARVAALEQEVVIERTRAALARDLPHLLARRRGEKAERPPGSVAGRGRASRGRQRVERPQDARADEPDA